MIFNETKRIIKRKEFFMMFAIMHFAVLIDFFINCGNAYGANLSSVRPAYCMTVLDNVSKSPCRLLFVIMLPIAAAAFASDLYKRDEQNGVDAIISTRSTKSRYIYSQACAIFIVVFMTFFMALILSIIFSVIAFPAYGYKLYGDEKLVTLLYANDRWSYPVGNGFGYFLYRLKALHPYLNLILFAFFRALIAGVFALLAYGISFLRFVNKYIVFLSAFIVYQSVEIGKQFVFRALEAENVNVNLTPAKYLISNLLNMNPVGNTFTYLKGILFYLTVSVFLILYGARRESIS